MWLPSWPNHPYGKWVGVDRCIASKVKDLRSKGIRTLASCCGHGKAEVCEVPIDDRDVSRAKMLGYRVEWDHPRFFVVMFDYQVLQKEMAGPSSVQFSPVQFSLVKEGTVEEGRK